MRIEENRVFEFKFPYYGAEISIPIRAQSRDEAAEELKKHIQSWMMELAMEFPKAAPDVTPTSAAPSGATPKSDPAVPSAIPTYALELDIEQLIKDLMPVKKPKGANTLDKLVKDWTGFAYSPENYPAIIEELKKLKTEK